MLGRRECRKRKRSGSTLGHLAAEARPCCFIPSLQLCATLYSSTPEPRGGMMSPRCTQNNNKPGPPPPLPLPRSLKPQHAVSRATHGHVPTTRAAAGKLLQTENKTRPQMAARRSCMIGIRQIPRMQCGGLVGEHSDVLRNGVAQAALGQGRLPAHADASLHSNRITLSFNRSSSDSSS